MADDDDELCPPSGLVVPAMGLPLADYSPLPLYCHEAFQRLLEHNHGIAGLCFIAEVMKFNKRLTEQRRILAVTPEAFYVCTPRAEVLRCSKLSLVTEVYTSKRILGLKIPGEYDLLVRITKENKVPDNLLIKYLLFVLRRLLTDGTKFHYEQPWLDVARPTNRATLKTVMVLNRPDDWTAQRPIPIPLLPWRSIALLDGFDAIWRRVHPARSKAVWAIKEMAEAELRGGDGGDDEDRDLLISPRLTVTRPPTAAGGEHGAVPRSAAAAANKPSRPSKHRDPNRQSASTRTAGSEGRKRGNSTAAPGQPARRSPRGVPHDTTSLGKAPEAQGNLGFFDTTAASPQRKLVYTTTVPPAVSEAMHRLGTDPMQDVIAAARAAPHTAKKPLAPPPPEPQTAGPAQPTATRGVYMAEGQGPYFPPDQLAKMYGEPEEEAGAGGQEDGRGAVGGSVPMDNLPPLDPLVVEMQGAASPVPATAFELEQAIRIVRDREEEQDVDTPKVSYAQLPPSTLKEPAWGGGSPPPPQGRAAGGGYSNTTRTPTPATAAARAYAHPGAQGSVGYRPARGGGGGGSAPAPSGPEQSSFQRAATFAKMLSDATNRPGGGGAEGRKMLSEMLRTTAALIATEDRIDRREAGLATAYGATPSPGGHRQNVRDAVQADAYLSTLLSEQHRQRAELDTVCKKLDVLLQSPQPHPHTPGRGGRWAHDAPDGDGGPGDRAYGSPYGDDEDDGDDDDANSLIGSALLPIPNHDRMSKYQKALHHSLRPLNHTPPSRMQSAARPRAAARGRTPKQVPRRSWVPS